MDSFNTKIIQLNEQFKNNAILSGVINVSILALVFVFFSIGFDLTKNLLLNFLDLSWANIFPSMVDLLTVAGLILILRFFAKTLARPDFLLHLDSQEDETIENQPKIIQFLNNTVYGKLLGTIWCIIGLFFFNYLLNIGLESINHQFSSINEWYLLSSTFSHLPIFPINLLCIFILMAIILPTTLNYAKYKLEIAEASNLHPTKTINKATIKEQVTEIKTYRTFIFIILSIMCIGMSLMQRHNIWLFQYNQPIAQQEVLLEKLSRKVSNFCDDSIKFESFHKQNVITVQSAENNFLHQTETSKESYAITSELKQHIINQCISQKSN